MNRIKIMIPLALLFIVIGIAVVSTSISIESSTGISASTDDFKVYFSSVSVNNPKIQYVLPDERTIIFENTLEGLNNSDVINFEVTNASSMYDAELTMNCTGGDEYFSIINTFDTSNDLGAKDSRSGYLTLKKLKSNISENSKEYETTCTLTANAVERVTINSSIPKDPTNRVYLVGDEIVIDTEKFNVISSTDTTVTMFSQYNIDSNYRQTTKPVLVHFGDNEFSSVNGNVDIETYSTTPKEYIHGYIEYLSEILNDTSITGNLITKNELIQLGCEVDDSGDLLGCDTSVHYEWLVNRQHWWTRSSTYDGDYACFLYSIRPNGKSYVNASSMGFDDWINTYSTIRPTITISKQTLSDYFVSMKG